MKNLKILVAVVIFASALPSFVLAGKANTNIYEKEETKIVTFTAKVRVVRDISDDIEVFFDSEKAKGAYYLGRNMGAFLKDLEDAKKSGAPITITADPDNRIMAVQKAAVPDKEDIKKKYDKLFGG